jgi:hypothetical protein
VTLFPCFRDDAIIFADLIGKLDVLRIERTKARAALPSENVGRLNCKVTGSQIARAAWK